MNRKEYLAKRSALLKEAEALIAENNYEAYEKKEKEINELDAQFENEAKAQANAAAMKNRLKDLSSQGIGSAEDSVTDGEIIAETGKSDEVKFAEESKARGRSLKANKEVKYGAQIAIPNVNNAVKLSTTGILLPRRQGQNLEPTFNEVSSLIDRVSVINRLGGESYQKSYVKRYGEGNYTDDDANYHETDVEFGLATMNKTKITAYSEEDEGVLKLPDVDYDAEIQKGIRIALRKKMTGEILIGDGEAGHLAGIFSNNATAIDPATDIFIDVIDEYTLDEIVYSYGGDEDVEDAAVLILNKMDLKKFVQLRSKNGNRIHKVTTNGNTGNIDGVPFIINSRARAISADSTTEGQYSIAYGSLSSYGLSIFSDIDVRRSEDFKFRSGQLAHRGSIYVGGNVIRHNGFLRVKKGDGGEE